MEPIGFCQEGLHTHQCCILNGHDQNEYNWDGKTTFRPDPQLLLHLNESSTPSKHPSSPSSNEENEGNCNELESPSKVCIVAPTAPRTKFVDARDEMSLHVRELAISQTTTLPETIWKKATDEMDKRHGKLWTGQTREFMKSLVGRTRAEVNHSDQFCKLENTHLHLVKDSNQSFLQYQGCFNHPEATSQLMHLAIFGNPALISLLLTPKIDLFFDGTFCMTPAPFYQTFIVMVFDTQTNT